MLIKQQDKSSDLISRGVPGGQQRQPQGLVAQPPRLPRVPGIDRDVAGRRLAWHCLCLTATGQRQQAMADRVDLQSAGAAATNRVQTSSRPCRLECAFLCEAACDMDASSVAGVTLTLLPSPIGPAVYNHSLLSKMTAPRMHRRHYSAATRGSTRLVPKKLPSKKQVTRFLLPDPRKLRIAGNRWHTLTCTSAQHCHVSVQLSSSMHRGTGQHTKAMDGSSMLRAASRCAHAKPCGGSPRGAAARSTWRAARRRHPAPRRCPRTGPRRTVRPCGRCCRGLVGPNAARSMIITSLVSSRCCRTGGSGGIFAASRLAEEPAFCSAATGSQLA